MSARTRYSRRTALKALGALGVLGALPVFHTPRARANTGKPPLRLIFFHFPAGLLRDEWAPRLVTSPTQWELPEMMAPLEPYKPRLSLFKNLDMLSSHFDTTAPSNAHIAGHTHYMTAALRKPGFGSLSNGISIDQFIARALHTPEPLTRLPSLEVVAPGGADGISVWAGGGVGVPALEDPVAIYKRVFGGLNAGAASADNDRAMAFLATRYSEMSAKLKHADERDIIDAHMEMRLAMHSRSKVVTPRDGRALTSEAFDMMRNTPTSGSAWHANLDLNMELVVQALYCDATRVANFSFSIPPATPEFGFEGGGWSLSTSNSKIDNWHGVDHQVSTTRPDASFVAGTAPYRAMKQKHLLFVQKLARLLERLDSYDESEGTLLDHTLIVGVSHIANGNHDLKDLPWMVIGDAQGFFTSGRVHELERRPHPTARNADQMKPDAVGRGHNDLFTSLAQAMGVQEAGTFGLQALKSSPILELHS